MKKDLLGIADLSSDEIYRVLDTAEAMREIGERPIKKVPTLRGKTVVNLFYEPSTRTRTSFEIAEKRLSADTLNIAVAASSVLKGETLADTAMNIEAMAPDMIVLRHASSGACHLLARICRSKIINAGDGMHEHPTQALLDAFTIREHKGKLAGLKVAIVGDLLHSRVLRSNVLLLKTMGAEIRACGPATLIPAGIERLGAHPTTSVDEAVEGADVVMLLRIQHERMQAHFIPSVREYFALFGMTPERLKRAIAAAAGNRNFYFFDAARIASAVAGQTIAANMVMLGYAYQVGALPLRAESIEHAIALNGEAVAMNTDAFRWGRRIAADPKAIEALKIPTPADATDARRLSQSFDETVARRDPDVIVIGDLTERGNLGDKASEKLAMMREHPAVSQLKAVKDNRIIELNGTGMDPSVRSVDVLRGFAAGLDKIAGRG